MANICLKSLPFKNLLCKTMSTDASKPIEKAIREKLTNALEAKHLDIINESYMHNVPKGSETHFKVAVVSDKFNGMTTIKRHQLIYKILNDELNNGVHALSLISKTVEEWDSTDKNISPSPSCRGGFGK